MAKACDNTGGQVDICSLYHQRPYYCPWFVAARGHADVSGLYWHLRPCWCLWLLLHWRPCWYPWVRLPLETIFVSMAQVAPEAMLMALACAATEGYDGVCGPCCCRGSCWCPWSVLPSKTMQKSMSHTPIGCKELLLQWCWWLQTYIWERGTWKVYVTTPTPTPSHPIPPQKRSSLEIHQRELFKKCNKDAVCSVALYNCWLLVGMRMGKNSVFSKGLVTGGLTMFQWLYGQHRLDYSFHTVTISLCLRLLVYILFSCTWYLSHS